MGCLYGLLISSRDHVLKQHLLEKDVMTDMQAGVDPAGGGERRLWPPKRQHFLQQTITLSNFLHEKDKRNQMSPLKSSSGSTLCMQDQNEVALLVLHITSCRNILLLPIVFCQN